MHLQLEKVSFNLMSVADWMVFWVSMENHLAIFLSLLSHSI